MITKIGKAVLAEYENQSNGANPAAMAGVGAAGLAGAAGGAYLGNRFARKSHAQQVSNAEANIAKAENRFKRGMGRLDKAYDHMAADVDNKYFNPRDQAQALGEYGTKYDRAASNFKKNRDIAVGANQAKLEALSKGKNRFMNLRRAAGGAAGLGLGLGAAYGAYRLLGGGNNSNAPVQQ